MLNFGFKLILGILLLPIIVLYFSGSSSDIFAADGYASLFILVAVIAISLTGFSKVRNGI